jgi:hypothetical protein
MNELEKAQLEIAQSAAENYKQRAEKAERRIAEAEAFLREATMVIEFDELGMGEFRERIVRFLVP